jgi:hypothetical protein
MRKCKFAAQKRSSKTLQKRPLLNSGVQSKSGAGKRNVDNWLDFNQKLLNGDHVVAPTKVMSSDLSTKAAKSSRKQSLEMTGAIKHLESTNACSRNPRNPSNSMTIEEFTDEQATTIQKCLKGRALKRAAKAMKRLAADQSHRKELMMCLGESSAMRDGLLLLLGAKDPEIAATCSNSDKTFVLDKARHLHDALCVMVAFTEEKECVTWLQRCELSAEMNFDQHAGRTAMKWCFQLHKRPDNRMGAVLKWMHSSRQRVSWSAHSPFPEDKSLLVRFKFWARSDLETLTVNKVQAWIDEILLKDWSADDFYNNKILHPVSCNMTARWMIEAGFKCK